MAHAPVPLIALLTDFGTADWYVSCMKAVMLRLCPRVQLVDITHEVPSHDIVVGAVTLAAAVNWFPPKTIFACVVDPGVGTARRLIAAHADERLFVGPDNGLLSLVLQRANRLTLVRLTNPRYWLSQISQTFHGRDIIAPVAAYLARGVPLQRLGIPQHRYHTLKLPRLQRVRGAIRGRLLHIDTFGNLITNLPASLVMEPRTCRFRYKHAAARVVSSYEEGRRGELVALGGSSGYVELSVREASAAKRYRAKRGDRVELRWL